MDYGNLTKPPRREDGQDSPKCTAQADANKFQLAGIDMSHMLGPPECRNLRVLAQLSATTAWRAATVSYFSVLDRERNFVKRLVGGATPDHPEGNHPSLDTDRCIIVRPSIPIFPARCS